MSSEQQVGAFDRRKRQSDQIIVPNDRRTNLYDRRRAPRNGSLHMLGYSPRAELVLTPSSEKVLVDRGYLEQLQQALQFTQFELNCSHDRYWDLYEFSPLSYVTLTATGLIVNLNLNTAKLLGVQREHLYESPFVRFVKESDSDSWNNLLLEVLQGELKQSVELSLMCVGFETIKVRLDCQRLTVAHDEITLLVTITRLAHTEHLHEQLSLAATAFQIEEGIMVTDTQMVILQVNRAFTRLTGFSSEEAIGRTPQLLHLGLQNPDFYQHMWHAIEQTGYWQGEIWNRRKNGEIYPEWLTFSAIKDPQGQIIYYVGSFMDISSRKQFEKTSFDRHKQLETQLQQKNAELQQIKAELNDINTALKVLVEHQETEHSDVREVLEKEIKQEIEPFLNQLKKGNHDAKQLALLRILEVNLQKLSASYGRGESISRVFQELTPKEIQVASMIRQGLSTKHIATTLSASTETINVHRKNIRKKLGLDNKAINLRSHLISFD